MGDLRGRGSNCAELREEGKGIVGGGLLKVGRGLFHQACGAPLAPHGLQLVGGGRCIVLNFVMHRFSFFRMV